ncbi:FHA domain-containing protein [Pseudonocardia acaciae]|uniref:FHA domain-containing protein n=1 Tax=Pseudonocardia acaciae TaxID=551276 RepID=UPI00048DD5DA|nr:FHA domain-containing protein [Pseudonocardia acaciae]
MTECALPHDVDQPGYCAGCGLAIGPAPPDPQDPPDPPGECGRCGEPSQGGRFCEACGYPYEPAAAPPPAATAPPQPSTWLAVITTDREFFESTRGAERGFELPVTAERRIELTGEVIRIGRRSRRHRTDPDIDLSAPPADPGVSREHARLLGQPDGSWVLVDSGSANGTYLNDDPERIPRNQLIPLAPGDRIRLGVWTVITLRPAPWSS